MQLMKNGKVIFEKIALADTAYKRMVGLMFSSDLGGYDSLWIKPCNSIHTFFMKYSLDIVFLNKDKKVVKVIHDLKPWRITRPYFSAFSVLEFAKGTLPLDIQEGDQLELVCTN